MAKLKKVTVQAFLPQLPAAHAYQQSEGSGSSLSVAIGRAVDELLAKPQVKGRRLQAMKLTVAVIE
jgi:hypothetical protein